MELRELRIGNAIYVGKNIEEVTGILNNGIYFGEHGYSANIIDFIKPVELTAVWLISLGFEDKQRGFFSIKAGSTFFRLTPPQFMGEWQTEYCWVYDDFKFTEIKYVHQLQNLYFCLTGNELKISE